MDNTTQQKKKFAHLRRTIDQGRYTPISPASIFSAATLCAVGISVYTVLDLLAKSGISIPHTAIIATATAVCCAAWSYQLHPYKSWATKIYSMLAEYDPVDKAAFERLQAAVEREGLSSIAVDEWCAIEARATFGPPPAKQRETYRDRFLTRKL